MKPPKAEDVRLMDHETVEDVAVGAPRFSEDCNDRRLRSALGCRDPARREDRSARAYAKTAA
jgi:hypothetical protein